MIDIGKSKTVSTSTGEYIDRTKDGRAWSQADYEEQNLKGETGRQYGVRDWSRASLNFEVVSKNGHATVQAIDHKKPSLKERWQQRIDEGYKATVRLKSGAEVKKPIKKSEVKLLMFDMGGNRARMHELAFDGEVQLGKNGIGKNGHVRRKKDIEEWAKDCYEFMAKKYGRENILSFVVHLDETNPHIHCYIVPLTKDGRLSYTDLFGGSHAQTAAAARKDGGKPNFQRQMSLATKQLHTEFADEVGDKWGLERGNDIKITGATHKSMQESLREKNIIEEEAERARREKAEQERLAAEAREKAEKEREAVEVITEQRTALETEVQRLEEKRKTANKENGNAILRVVANAIGKPLGEVDAELKATRKELKEAKAIADMRKEDFNKQVRDRVAKRTEELTAENATLKADRATLTKQVGSYKAEAEKTRQKANLYDRTMAIMAECARWGLGIAFAQALIRTGKAIYNGVLRLANGSEVECKNQEITARAWQKTKWVMVPNGDAMDTKTPKEVPDGWAARLEVGGMDLGQWVSEKARQSRGEGQELHRGGHKLG